MLKTMKLVGRGKLRGNERSMSLIRQLSGSSIAILRTMEWNKNSAATMNNTCMPLRSYSTRSTDNGSAVVTKSRKRKNVTNVDNLSKEMVAFFDACRRPILSKNVTSIGEFTRDDECITKVSYGIGDDSIEAYVLPKSVAKWPSFYESKQYNAVACEVLCVRTDTMNNVRGK